MVHQLYGELQLVILPTNCHICAGLRVWTGGLLSFIIKPKLPFKMQFKMLKLSKPKIARGVLVHESQLLNIQEFCKPFVKLLVA